MGGPKPIVFEFKEKGAKRDSFSSDSNFVGTGCRKLDAGCKEKGIWAVVKFASLLHFLPKIH